MVADIPGVLEETEFILKEHQENIFAPMLGRVRIPSTTIKACYKLFAQISKNLLLCISLYSLNFGINITNLS